MGGVYKWRYERSVKEREDRLEAERQRILDEKRLALEQEERNEKAKVDHLLHQAESISKAQIIREYIAMVEARAGEIDKPTNEIMECAKWAHKQADKIDPIVNF